MRCSRREVITSPGTHSPSVGRVWLTGGRSSSPVRSLNGRLSAWASAQTVSTVGLMRPLSSWDTLALDKPARRASSAWESPSCARATWTLVASRLTTSNISVYSSERVFSLTFGGEERAQRVQCPTVAGGPDGLDAGSAVVLRGQPARDRVLGRPRGGRRRAVPRSGARRRRSRPLHRV